MAWKYDYAPKEEQKQQGQGATSAPSPEIQQSPQQGTKVWKYDYVPKEQPKPQSQPQTQNGIAVSYEKPNSVAPVQDYTAVNAKGTPTNVSKPMEQFSQVNVATQEYADEMQSQIIRDYYNYQKDPNYQGMLNRTYTNQTYEYLKRKNKGASDVAWSVPKPEDDLFTNWLPQWTKAQQMERDAQALLDAQPKKVEQVIEESAYRNAKTDAQRAIMDSANMEHGNWNLMNWWDKAWYILTPSSSPYTVDEAPGWATKLAKTVMPTAMSAGMGSMVGGIVGGIVGSVVPVAGTVAGSTVGSAIGAAVFGGATFLQGLTGIEIPVIADIQEKANWLGDKTEQALATVSTAKQEAKRILGENASTIELCKTMGEVLQDPQYKYLWDVSKIGYEVGVGTYIDEITNGIYNAGVRISNNLFGTDYKERDIADVNRNNIGRSGWEETIEGTYGGTSLIDTYLPVYEGLFNAAVQQGLTEQDAKDFALNNLENYVYNYRGATGLTNDFIAQSYQDPTNFIQFATAKLAQGVGKVTGDTALANAGRAAAGNPLIDALDPVSQPIVEGILSAIYPNRKMDGPDIFKTYGSQGIDTITRTWGSNLQNQVDVTKMSNIQKQIANIDSTGKIRGYEPNRPITGIKVIDDILNLGRKTEEAKMYEMSEMTTRFVGSLLFEGDAKLYQVPDLVAQITGKADIPDKGGVLSAYKNTALLNTLRDGLANAPESLVNNISDDIMKYRTYGTNRQVLASVSEQLKMTPKEIMDALDNRKKGADVPEVQKKKGKKRGSQQDDSMRQALFKKMRDLDITFTGEDGKVMDTEAVIKSIDKFRGNRKLYSETFFKADIMEKLGRAVDEYNMKRYNIQPDAWWSRMSDLTKSMQSIALLNFSPSYMVNNFLNNMITRTVAGVGGVDTDFVKTVNAERGLSFSRDTDVYDNTGKAIKKSKKTNDTLQKFSDLFKKATDQKLLKGVNNIDIEGSETRAASDLGMRRYWDATWEHNIPDFPSSWDALGIDDVTKAKIRDIAYDSPNVKVFYDKLMGEVALPQAQSVIKHMLDNNYDGNMKTVMAESISKMPWISRILDEALLTNDANELHNVMDNLRDTYTSDINMKNVQQMESTFDDYRVRFSGEGLGAVGDAIDVINDMFMDVWIRQSKQNMSMFIDRAVQGIDRKNFDTRYEKMMNLQTGDYNIVRGYAVKMAAAMIEGLGLKDDVSYKILENTMKRFDVATEQIRQNHEVYQKFGIDKDNNPNYDLQYYRQSRLDMLKKTQDILIQADTELDKILIQYLRDTLDPSYEGRIDTFEKWKSDIIEAKKKLNAQDMKDLEKSLNSSQRKRAQLGIEHERTTNKQKQHIKQLQYEAGLLFQSLDNTSRTNPTQAQPMTLEQTLRLSMLLDEAKIGTDRAGEFLTHYIDGTNPQTVFDPVDYHNKEINSSFKDYYRSKISDPVDLAVNQTFYDAGDAVILGSADTTHKTYTTASDEYKLVNPKADVNAAEWVQVKCEPVMTADGIAEAGVYHNGEHIGYIIEGMPEVVHVRDNDFPVIGMSKDKPNTYLVLVKDEPWEITIGNPKGADFTIYAQENFHPVAVGDTPTIQPWGQAALESSLPLREAFDLLETQALTDLQNARSNGSVLGKMTPEQREAVLSFVDSDLRPAYSMQRYQTQKYGDMMVDMALLNYNSRYGFDNMLTAIMPYQYWMTRSVMNWGKRMITQPKWFASYAKIEKLIEKNKRDIVPSRLEGTIGIPMPNLGDGLGSNLFIDPLGIIFPFKQFNDAPNYYIGNLHTVHQNTLTVIDEYYNEGKPYNGHIITDQEYWDAQEGKGDLYNQVFKEMQRLDETDTTGLGLMGTFLNPNVFVDAIWKKARGREGSISSSPMFRLGNTIKAAGDQTGMQWLTDAIGGAMQVPDKAFRKALGIEQNPEGAYFDYYMTNFITDMYLTKEISYDDMTRALAEGPDNRIYQEALHRYRQQQAVRQQGGAFMREIGQSLGGNKQTTSGEILGSIAASALGAKVMSQGEEMYRDMRTIRNTVKSTNNDELIKKFSNEFPEYSIHNWSYEDDPEERIHKMMVSKVWTTYMALPQEQRNRVSDALGDRFRTLFLNKETRATDYLDDEELGEWIRAMNGDDPTFTDNDINNPMRQAQEITWYADTPLAQYEAIRAEFDRRFPNFSTKESEYYALPEEMRPQFEIDNPDFVAGREFRSAVKQANPAAGVIWDERSPSYKVGQGEYDSIIQARIGELSDSYLKRFRDYAQAGIAMPDWAKDRAYSIYASANSKLSFDEWMRDTFK